jgi:prepilin-type N-terminal cleavage/methylation domain-containing protein
MKKNRRLGFTLVEVLIVVVIMAVLAATIIPQFSDSSKDAKISTVKFNVHTLRSQIEMYKSQHDGRLPGDDLAELIVKTNVKGTTSVGDGPLVYGPYIQKIPENPFTSSATVKEIAAAPAVAGDVTTTDGWLYHKASGGLWINHADYLDE